MYIGFIIGTVVAVVVALVALAGVLVFGHAAVKLGDTEAKAFGGFSIGLLVVTLAVYFLATWPTFNMEYHSYHQVGGVVSDVQARFLAGESGGSTQNFAVQFEGSDQVYRCDDTRCALIKQGDYLALSCIRDWQWAAGSTDGYGCQFVSSRKHAS